MEEKEQLVADLREDLKNAKALSNKLERKSGKDPRRDDDSRDKDELEMLQDNEYGKVFADFEQEEHDDPVRSPTRGSQKSIPQAHVGACKVCHQLGIDCDRSLPRCRTCEYLNARCTGFNPLSQKEPSRRLVSYVTPKSNRDSGDSCSYVVFLENRVHYLEQRLDNHIIPYKPGDGFDQDDQAEVFKASHDSTTALAATSSHVSNTLLHIGDNHGSPITPPISAAPLAPDSSNATRKSHLDLPRIVVISDENVCTEAIFPITPASSETNVADQNGLFTSEEIEVLHSRTPVSPANDPLFRWPKR